MYPYSNPTLITRGLNAIKTIKWGTFLEGTQKTLGVINQAIPIVYQVKPIVSNAKTLFKIAGAINTPEETTNHSINNTTNQKQVTSNNSPIFYI